MLYHGAVGSGPTLSVNLGAHDRTGEGFIMMSAFGYTGAIKTAAKDLKKKCNVSLNYYTYTVQAKTVEVVFSHMPESEYSHLFAYKKDITYEEDGKEKIKLFMFIHPENSEEWQDLYGMSREEKFPQQLIDTLFDKLYKMSPAPILKEWIPYLLRGFINAADIREATCVHSSGTKEMKVYTVNTAVEDIVSRISRGLELGHISINGTNDVSSFMSEVQGIDAYLNEFSEVFTKKIQESFVPLFMPKEDPYCKQLQFFKEYVKWSDGITLYPAQMDVAQSVINCFDGGQKGAFVVAEMGSGIDKVIFL